MRQVWEHEFTADTDAADYITVQRLLIDMGAYFASFTLPFDRPDCYSRFIAALAQSGLVGSGRVGIATMNYDCLLDECCVAGGVPVDVSPTDPHPGALTVWKPHGACNLVLAAVAWRIWWEMSVVACPYFVSGGPLLAIPPICVSGLYSDQVNFPPAMSLYASGKHSPVTPGLIDASRERWMDWSRSADVVISIGARFNRDDTHIWSGVTEGQSQILFVGDDESAQACKKLAGPDRFDHLGGRFDDALQILSTRLQELV